ncbi:CRISPR-associated endonuclease Cas2 [Thermocrinis sp.]|uniref:CRISPR-associated endonuclease Cas2 n=1 Tax=Thermocrinis sp. TaxID=2024383 RepID=UPI002FDD0144
MRVVLFYDIDTTEKEGQRRLQRALKTARKYLNHVQKSVFEGSLNLSGIERLKYEILKVVDREKDSVIIYILDETTNYKREILTNTKDPTDNLL